MAHSTRHFKVNIQYPSGSYPSTTTGGEHLLLASTATTSSNALTAISGNSSSYRAYVNTATSGENEYTLIITGTTASTMYVAVGVIRPHSQMWCTGTTSCKAIYNGTFSSITIYSTDTSFGSNRYITDGYVARTLELSPTPYTAKNVWTKPVLDGDDPKLTTYENSVNYYGFKHKDGTAVDQQCVNPKNLIFETGSTIWGYYDTSYPITASTIMVKGYHNIITRTNKKVTVQNSLGVSIPFQFAFYTRDTGGSNVGGWYINQVDANGTKTGETTMNVGEINSEYLFSEYHVDVMISPFPSGYSTIKARVYFAGFYSEIYVTDSSSVVADQIPSTDNTWSGTNVYFHT